MRKAPITQDGKKIVFTSMRAGDLDIYTMDADGRKVRQLTNELGYDGGPFWSYDGKANRYRAKPPAVLRTKGRLCFRCLMNNLIPAYDTSRGSGNERTRRIEQRQNHAQWQSQLLRTYFFS